MRTIIGANPRPNTPGGFITRRRQYKRGLVTEVRNAAKARLSEYSLKKRLASANSRFSRAKPV